MTPSSPAQEPTKVLPKVAQPTPAASSAPRPITPPPPASMIANKPQAPLAALQPKAPTEGPQKRRLIAGVVGGSLLALGIVGVANAGEPTIDAPVPDGITDADSTGQAPQAAVAAPTTHNVVIHTDKPVASTAVDDLSLDDATDIARTEIGADGFFKWHGELHTTTTKEEFDNKTDEERADFVGNTTWHENHDAGQIVQVNGVDMEVAVPFLEKVGEWTIFKHNDETGVDQYYLGDAEGHGKLLENLDQNEYGELVRKDPETGEETPFTPTTILDQVADGKIDVQFYPSDVEVVDGLPSTEPLLATVFDPQAEYKDPYADQTVEPATSETPPAEDMSTSDLLNEKLHSLAEAAGIDDVRKIKLHEEGDGYDYKIKGDEGEKVKGHFSMEDLHKPDSAAEHDSTPAHEPIPDVDSQTNGAEHPHQTLPDYPYEAEAAANARGDLTGFNPDEFNLNPDE